MANLPTTDITNYGNPPGQGPLRPGGVTVASITPQADASLPSTPSAAVKKQSKALCMARDLAAGPEAVRAKERDYLPQDPGETGENYKGRLERSVFFNVFGHTIKGLVGQVFRRDPVLGEDVPPIIATQMENVDLNGTHFDVFARDLLHDALTAGHSAILVEYPHTGGAQNSYQEAASEVRPYWVPILKDNIVSWRTATENGHVVLTQLVLRECTLEPAGDFGEVEVKRYRVFTRTEGIVAFRLLQIHADRTISVVDEGTYPTQTEIPVAEIVTSGRKSMFESDPPLLDLAYLNVAHYQQWSDYANSMHKTCVPIFATVGLVDQYDSAGNPVKLVLGPNTAINLPLTGDAKYVSHDGAALQQIKQGLDDLKSDMGTLGLAMLAPNKRTAETAQAKAIDKSSEDSALATTARGLEDGLERALAFHAKYLKMEDGGSVRINREFSEQTMAADMLNAWTTAVRDAGLPERFMIDAMVEGSLIELDEGETSVDVADEMASNTQAAQDQKALQAASNLATAGAMTGQPPKTSEPAPVPAVPPAQAA